MLPVGLCHEKKLKSRVSLYEPFANINIGAPKRQNIIDRFQIRYMFLGLGSHQSQKTVNTIYRQATPLITSMTYYKCQ